MTTYFLDTVEVMKVEVHRNTIWKALAEPYNPESTCDLTSYFTLPEFDKFDGVVQKLAFLSSTLLPTESFHFDDAHQSLHRM